ncbi:MAG: Cytochrome [Blastococcus sp.]|nr:Cytochrome [Blastococcus sp.]
MGTSSGLRPWVEALAGRLVDELLERSGGSQPVDLLAGVAEQLPVAVTAELLGVPDADRPLLRAADGLAAVPDGVGSSYR